MSLTRPISAIMLECNGWVPHLPFCIQCICGLQEVWIQLCNLAADGFITELGVCDMDEPSLKDICESSDVSTQLFDLCLYVH